MSDNGDHGEGSGNSSDMAQGDVDFIFDCLKNVVGGPISVDTQKVAEVRGYKNHRSVQNRLNTLKKKYDLPFGSSSKSAGEGSKKASDAAGPNQPAVPHTPSKERVKKAKARTPLTSSRKPTTSKAKGKGKAQNAVKKEEGRQDDESSDEELVVESPKFENISDDEAVFGKKDTDEETFDENV